MKMNFIESDERRKSLYPFSSIRALADIRIGILTIREKWQRLIEQGIVEDAEDVSAPSWVIPTLQNALEIQKGIIASDDLLIQYPWDIFRHNAQAIEYDFQLLTKGRISEKLDDSNQCIYAERIFLEPGARVQCSILNATEGPIYIGRNAQVMEGCMIRGPFALCENAVLKMGAKIYGATTLGPYAVGGGEIKNSVIMGYSNKAHDGYLGDSVVGEWCNIGAGTSNSNIRNNAGMVKVWNNLIQEFTEVGLKCGLILGDFSRVAINTSFNTGTMVGVCCNVFGEKNPPKFIPDFTWGNERYEFEKALTDIGRWKKMKNRELSESETNGLYELFQSKTTYES